MRVVGLVLAAGRSRRMGSPKALLRLGGASFLERVCAALREGGCDGVVVVAGPTGEAGADAVAAAAVAAGAEVLRNPEAGAEQIDSLRRALRALGDEPAAAVVSPVDVPAAGAAVVAALIDAWRRRDAPIVLPSHGGRDGHPALFARGVWPELLAGPLPEGARTVIHADASRVARVEVGVAAVLHDVDTPDDYRRLLDDAPR
jgi:molybdenum cofactor cytidylyltransferase